MMRANAVDCLAQMGPMARPAIPSLARLLKEDEVWLVRANAVAALGVVGKGDAAATAALTEALNDKQVIVRRSATNVLLKIDPEAAAKAGQGGGQDVGRPRGPERGTKRHELLGPLGRDELSARHRPRGCRQSRG